MSQDLIISVYGSHNAAVSMYYKGKYYVVEVERWTGVKNVGLSYYLASRNYQQVFDDICEWLLSHTDGEEVDVYLTGYADLIRPKFSYKRKISYDHHTAHAATAFYQSPYNEMLIFTFDGGGDGAFFNVYTATRENGIKLLSNYKYDLGFPYMVLADTLSDIKRETLSIGNLVYAGKLMGLCAYGNVREDWLPHFSEFYEKFYYDGESYIGGAQVMKTAMTTLFKNINLDYIYGETRFTGQDAWDIAATSQKAFEEQFFKIANKYLQEYPELPVGMAGGCALNVLLNTRLSDLRDGKIYVPPNTNDCGMAVGGIMWHLNPSEQVDLTYSGLPILDEHLLHSYVNDLGLEVYDRVSTRELAAFISEGKIVGMLQGNSEHGSRALGNRSIICSPVDGMKDIINNKVKHREWYRPFAPVVRIEEVNKYFYFSNESRHMTFAAKVREEYKQIIPAVTHEDGTGRLQTVSPEQNPILYDILTHFDDITGNGVLLNTSFNVNGKPILTTLRDAFNLLVNTELDAVYFKNRLIVKSGGDADFVNLRASGTHNVQPLPTKRGDNKCDAIIIGAYKDPSNICAIVKELKRLGHRATVMCLESEADNLLKIDSSIKTHVLTLRDFYHSDRMSELSQKDISDRLKFLWVRELIRKKPPQITAIIIDSAQTSTSIIEGVQNVISEHLLSGLPEISMNTKQDMGVVCGKVEDLVLIGNVSESYLLQSLNEMKTPEKDCCTIDKYIKDYNRKFKLN